MKKILCLIIIMLVSAFRVYASDIKFIQIDDLKYSPYSDESVQNFKNTIDEINKQKNLSFVIFTGNNIARSDKIHLKSFLKTANKLNVPYYVALGHKDLNKKKGLSKVEYMKIVKRLSHQKIKSPNYVFSKKGMVFIVADGAKEFIATPFGYYREDALNFVDNELTKHSKNNVVILQHFPVYPPNENEAFRTYKVEKYIQIIEAHKNVKAIISGFGVNSENDVNGIKYITTAAYPAYRVIEIIDCSGTNPSIWSTLK